MGMGLGSCWYENVATDCDTASNGSPMAHFVLAGALLFALLAIVGIAIGACLSIARDLLLEKAGDEQQPTIAANRRISLAERFAVGLRHAANFTQARGGSVRGHGSRDT